jgi:phosphoribosylaminoimidazolecarboxamide formyltransferase/IMP cyclohydrolase
MSKVPAPPLADLQPLRRALLSVSDKRGVADLARALTARGVEILSTGGTARHLVEAGVPVVQVSDYTGSPEIMDGRVKTLHPRVHGGILMRGDIDADDLAKVGGKPIDLVVVNLYPFEATLAKPGVSHPELVEEIDIGGPSMVRSAAKSHPRVTVLVDPDDYQTVLDELTANDGHTTLATRTRLAAKAFAHTASYDGAIAGYLSRDAEAPLYPKYLTLTFEKGYGLRYGENPHQTGGFYRQRGAAAGTLARAESLGAGGKELSFNNFVDVEAALSAVREHGEATKACVIVKHANPCGVATAETLVDAYRAARDADGVSAFGGIVALNHEVDPETARVMGEIFLECIVAPSFSTGALEALRQKKNLRLLAVGAPPPRASSPELDYRRISGGLVAMSADLTGEGEVEAGKVVTKRAPTAEELRALAFAWKVTKHVKSNAIVLARAEGPKLHTVGVGAGQMSRVVSVEIALKKAGDAAKGSVLGSDAFFPFPDGVEAAARGGVTAIAQPGGSVKDADVIACADQYGIAMVFTGVRHFRH